MLSSKASSAARPAAGVEFAGVEGEARAAVQARGQLPLQFQGAIARKGSEVNKTGLGQGLPGQIFLPEIVVGVGGQQDGAFALRVQQDIGPAAFARLHHIVQVDAGQAVLQEISVRVGPQPAHQGHRHSQASQSIGGIGRLAASEPSGRAGKFCQQVPEPGLVR